MTGRRAIDLTCGGLLPADVRPDAPAVFAADGALLLSQGELRAGIADLAARLQRPHKAFAFLLCRNTPEVLLALFGLLAAGHAVALIDTAMDRSALARLVDTYAPDLVLGAESDIADLAGPERIRSDLGGLGLIEATRPSGFAIHPDLAVLLSTSGTTGSVKFVRLTLANLTANADQIGAALDIGPEGVGSAHLPFHYSYGLSVIDSHLRKGAAVHLWPDSVTVPEFWAAATRAGVTQFPGVPFHYGLLARGDIDRLAPPTLKTFTQAGGALDLRLQSRMHELLSASGRRFFVMYGQTEASPRIATLPAGRLPEKLGSVGPALQGGQLSVIDEAGDPLPPRAVGRVIYAGPNVMLGYAERREDLARGDEQHGRIETGDLGWLDEDGYLYLSGRAKRFAKLYGLRISLDEVEARFRPAGEVAAVEGRERIGLFATEAAAVTALLPTVAAEYKLPVASFAVREVGGLPRKSSGKIDYARLEFPQ